MQLVGKRILKFYCNKCDGSEIKAFYKEFNNKLEEVKQDFSKSILGVQNKVEESTAALNTQISIITTTNKEVIQMLSSRNIPLNPHERKIKPPESQISLLTPESEPNNIATNKEKRYNRSDSQRRRDNRINQDKTEDKTDNTESSNTTTPSARPHVVKGSGSSVSLSSASFASAARRIWLSVSKVKIGTSVNDISTYLKDKYPGHVFTVELQPKRPEATSLAFKVGADPDLYNNLYNGENWPSGIIIKRFSFRRTNNTAQQWN